MHGQKNIKILTSVGNQTLDRPALGVIAVLYRYDLLIVKTPSLLMLEDLFDRGYISINQLFSLLRSCKMQVSFIYLL